eukprot:comp21504_c1_seq1/m.29828 comp21504_c1_seq1/g.29828  ORF comp21504_c1_seq1/g.29828 comp21504_c1_seq1/m.29828 type:complete len:1382 (-) comp21504_c1_seq1:407-4552(-)
MWGWVRLFARAPRRLLLSSPPLLFSLGQVARGPGGVCARSHPTPSRRWVGVAAGAPVSGQITQHALGGENREGGLVKAISNSGSDDVSSRDVVDIESMPGRDFLGNYTVVRKLRRAYTAMFANFDYRPKSLQLALYNCGPSAPLNATPEARATIARDIWLAAKQHGWRFEEGHYGQLIRALGQDASHLNVVEVVEDMVREGVAPGKGTLKVVLDCYTHHKDLGKALWAVQLFRGHGVTPDSKHYVQLLRLVDRGHMYDRTDDILERMKADNIQPDGPVYEILMQLAASRGKVSEVEGYLQQVQREGYVVTEGMLVQLIRAHVVGGDTDKAIKVAQNPSKYGVEGGERLHASLIDCVAARGGPKAVEETLDWLRGEGGRVGARVYTRSISQLARAGNHERARQLFDEMLGLDLRLEIGTYMVLVRQAAMLGDHCNFKRLLVHMQDNKISVTPYEINRLAWMYRGSSDISGRFVTREIKLDMFEFFKRRRLVGPGTVATMFLYLPIKKNNWDGAYRTAEWLINHGVSLNLYTCNVLLRAGLVSNRANYLQPVLALIKDSNLTPDNETARLMLRAARRQNASLQQATAILNHLRVSGTQPDTKTYQVLVRLYKRDMESPALMEVLQKMHTDGVEVPQWLYVAALRGCVRRGEVAGVTHILRSMDARSLPASKASDWVLGYHLSRNQYPEAAQALRQSPNLLAGYLPDPCLMRELLRLSVRHKAPPTTALILACSRHYKDKELEISPRVVNWVVLQQVKTGDPDAIRASLRYVYESGREDKRSTDPLVRALLRIYRANQLDERTLKLIRDWVKRAEDEALANPMPFMAPRVCAQQVLAHLSRNRVGQAFQHIRRLWLRGIYVDRVISDAIRDLQRPEDGDCFAALIGQMSRTNVLVPRIDAFRKLLVKLYEWDRPKSMGVLVSEMMRAGLDVPPSMRVYMLAAHLRARDVKSALAVANGLADTDTDIPLKIADALGRGLNLSKIPIDGPIESQKWHPQHRLHTSLQSAIDSSDTQSISHVLARWSRIGLGPDPKLFSLAMGVAVGQRAWGLVDVIWGMQGHKGAPDTVEACMVAGQWEVIPELVNKLSQQLGRPIDTEWQQVLIRARRVGPQAEEGVWRALRASVPIIWDRLWVTSIVSAGRRGDISTAFMLLHQMEKDGPGRPVTAYRAAALACLRHPENKPNSGMAARSVFGIISVAQKAPLEAAPGLYALALMLAGRMSVATPAFESALKGAQDVGLLPFARFYAVQAALQCGGLDRLWGLVAEMEIEKHESPSWELARMCLGDVVVQARKHKKILLAARAINMMLEHDMELSVEGNEVRKWVTDYRKRLENERERELATAREGARKEREKQLKEREERLKRVRAVLQDHPFKKPASSPIQV